MVKVKLFKKDNSDDKKQTLEIKNCGMNGRGMGNHKKICPTAHLS
jgi:hypothetical protein